MQDGFAGRQKNGMADAMRFEAHVARAGSLEPDTRLTLCKLEQD